MTKKTKAVSAKPKPKGAQGTSKPKPKSAQGISKPLTYGPVAKPTGKKNWSE